VKRPMNLEFERADAVRDAFDVIAEAMGEVIHRIDAPFCPGMMVPGVTDAVEHRVPKPDVRGRHVYLRAEGPRPVRKLARLHAREQIEAFLDGSVAERGFLAGTIRRAAIFVGVLG